MVDTLADYTGCRADAYDDDNNHEKMLTPGLDGIAYMASNRIATVG
jgi:hypothetical protein